MKKIVGYVLLVATVLILTLIVFKYKGTKQPFIHYNVYLDSELVGTIESKKELEDYINSQARTIRNNVNKWWDPIPSPR